MASGRPKPKGQEADFFGCDYRHDALSILVVGASGDLAAKKTYPALLSLFRDGYLPEHVVIVGYARSRKTDDEFRAHVSSKLSPGGVSDPAISRFLQRCFYRAGPYGDEERLAEVYEDVAKLEADARPDAGTVNRMFYFAVPPSVFAAMGRALKAVAESPRGWNRYLIEKPFGSDLESFEKLHEELSSVLPEASVYRLDHYLGKQMIKTMLLLRFGNAIFEPLWNRNHIASITFSFKENFGTAGRGGFYDDIGVIRDVVRPCARPASRFGTRSARSSTAFRRSSRRTASSASTRRTTREGRRRTRTTTGCRIRPGRPRSRRASCASKTLGGTGCRSSCAPARR
jgi:glucose-6-phosphate 1-dehydrogenase